MEKNQDFKKTRKPAVDRIRGIKFFKETKILFVLKPRDRVYFEKLFNYLSHKQKKEILAKMAEFEATTGEWKFLAEKFASKHLKSFAFKMFKKALGEEYRPTVTVQVTESASETAVQNTSSAKKQESSSVSEEKDGFFRSLFKKKSA